MRLSRSKYHGLILLTLFLACAQKKDDKSSGSSDETESASTIDVNPLAQAYPEGLQINALSEEVATETVTTGALEIDATALVASTQDGFQLAVSESLLGYDRSACESYHTALPANKKIACSCSHKQAMSQAPGGGGGDKGGEKNGPTHDEIKGAIFGAGDAAARADAERLKGGDDVECFDASLGTNFQLIARDSNGSNLLDPVYGYEFDWGITSGTIVDENESSAGSEVTMVAFTQGEVASTQAYLEFGKKFFQGLLCEAKKGGLSRELEVDEELQLAETVKDKVPPEFGVTTANIKRVSASEGKAYETRLEMTMTDPVSEGSLNFEMTFSNTQVKEDGSQYHGKIQMSHSLPPSPEQNSTEKIKAIGIQYSGNQPDETSPRRVKIELRMAEIKATTTGIWDSNGLLDLNAGANSDGSFSLNPGPMNTNISNIKYISYDGYPTEGPTNFAYWRNPGENDEENARGFVYNVKRGSDNVIRGCAYVGASAPTDVSDPDGLSIRKALRLGKSLEVKGFLRPFLCPYDPALGDPNNKPYTGGNLSRRFGAKMWKQCFVQNSDGSYSIDKDATGGQDFQFGSVSALSDYKAPSTDFSLSK